jgi:hypothetical protein
MQLNRTGIGLIAFFGLIGLGMVVAPIPGEAGWILKSIGVIWSLVAGGLYLFARSQKRKADHQDWVFQNGVRGRATIVKAGSGATVNEMPLMKLTIELDVPGQERRQVSRRQVMPVFAAMRMEPGIVLPVYVSPQDPEDLVLVW